MLSEAIQAPDPIKGRKEYPHSSGGVIVYVPSGTDPCWRAVNSLGVLVGKTSSYEEANLLLGGGSPASAPKRQAARCVHCRSAAHASATCPVERAAEKQRENARRLREQRQADLAAAARAPTVVVGGAASLRIAPEWTPSPATPAESRNEEQHEPRQRTDREHHDGGGRGGREATGAGAPDAGAVPDGRPNDEERPEGVGVTASAGVRGHGEESGPALAGGAQGCAEAPAPRQEVESVTPLLATSPAGAPSPRVDEDPHTLDDYLKAVRTISGPQGKPARAVDVKRAVWGAETGMSATRLALEQLVAQGRADRDISGRYRARMPEAAPLPSPPSEPPPEWPARLAELEAVTPDLARRAHPEDSDECDECHGHGFYVLTADGGEAERVPCICSEPQDDPIPDDDPDAEVEPAAGDAVVARGPAVVAEVDAVVYVEPEVHAEVPPEPPATLEDLARKWADSPLGEVARSRAIVSGLRERRNRLRLAIADLETAAADGRDVLAELDRMIGAP